MPLTGGETDADGCRFCTEIAQTPACRGTELAVVLEDAFPVAPGHRLIVPREHHDDLFSLAPAVLQAMWRLIAEECRDLSRGADHGVNVGANVGRAAGQTVAHAHVHVIPRVVGDVANPRGGVRGVIPLKQDWAASGPTDV
ncbi:HIT family protein [Paraconexibacter antarcticus]|uniref:HIT family protein n=1 Tax=Paraconexibacter antarcticus TaxID=2949664 RepID=A0ABY5E1Q8_9ACTN|nr:HIT family protein [Paraconexibacter antarcticus]UTI67097.1 HIT family protein [Paraconexibacter antarcticus]